MSNDGFTKLFSSIITSSIWSEDDKTRIMWITMLASSDSQGFVTGSIPGMAAVARMSLEDAEKSIKALCKPDPYSRSKEYDGRRLLECEDGWLIANYVKYRQPRDPEKRREQNREAKRRQRDREKKNQCQQDVSQTQPMSAQAEAEADKERVSPDVFIAYWNSKKNLPKIKAFTEQRKKKLRIRLKEKLFAESWRQAIDRISASKFCIGQNDRGWRADIDFLLDNDTNYAKVLEGKYDNNGEPKAVPFDEESARQRKRMLAGRV